MKKMQFADSVRLAIVALSAFWLTGHMTLAQSADSSRNSTSQQQPMHPDNTPNARNAAPEATFSGKIVKSEAKLVLTDPDNRTTYQLDDQLKAQDFLNQRVRITGALDPATGTIRVSAINPM